MTPQPLMIYHFKILTMSDIKTHELWKDIPGWVGLYRVSTHGRVKSMERMVKMRGLDKVVRSRYLTPASDKDGYLLVQLSKDGKQFNYRVHRLVALAFIKNPDSLPIINHIDNDVTNNCFWNLEWSTHLLNMRHSANQGRKLSRLRKFTSSEVMTIRSIYSQGGVTMDTIAATYNVTRPTIGYIINSKTYKL